MNESKTTNKDPICGMTVDEATAIHAERDGNITLDDKKVKLEELKEGFPVKVTFDDKFVVTKIDAKSKK